MRADGLGEAASNDACTLASCEDALAAYQRRRLDGIGPLAIASDDPYFFVDLDDCRDPQTGAIDPMGREDSPAVPAHLSRGLAWREPG